MKWTLSINQKVIVEDGHDIDIVDAAILETMKQMQGANGITKMVDGNTDFYWMAHQKLCIELPILKIKKDTMYRRIKKMIDKGYITPHPLNKQMRVTYYRVTPLTDSLFGNIGKKSDSTEQYPKGVSDENPKDNNTNIDTNIDQKEIFAPIGFDVFWNAYQYKRSKTKSIEAWEKLKPEQQQIAIDAIPKYLADIKRTNTTQCHGSTWLNQKRWEDEYEASKPTHHTDIIGQYFKIQYLPKIINKDPKRFTQYEKEFNEHYTQLSIKKRLEGLSGIKNKTLTPYLIFDICHGMLSKKCGTQPDRRWNKFLHWFNKLSEYNQNKGDLPTLFKKHLIQQHG